MIVTITMNPAVDKSTSVEAMLPEKKLRCDTLVSEPGGGGINVSKAIKRFGGKSRAIFPSGGPTGEMLEIFMREEGIDYTAVPIEATTRESFSVTETKSNAQYRFVLPGPELSAREMERCFEILRNLEEKPTVLVASGSLPPGVPEDFYARLARISKELDAKFVVDTSGKPLQLAVDEGAYLLKPNLNELTMLAGKKHLELDEVDDAALEIIHRGKCAVIVVSLGPSGALLVTKDGYEHVPAPTVKKNTTVGAGDSMVAGMVWKLAEGASLKEMVQFGVACGTAATMNSGTQLFNMEDVHRLYDWLVRCSDKHKLHLG